MESNVLEQILHAEDAYHETVRAHIRDAEKYVDESKKRQSGNVENLKYEWYLFDKSEREKFERDLENEEKRVEREAAESKERLLTMQRAKIEEISERLAGEALSLIWR